MTKREKNDFEGKQGGEIINVGNRNKVKEGRK